jgi:hypothetical protein
LQISTSTERTTTAAEQSRDNNGRNNGSGIANEISQIKAKLRVNFEQIIRRLDAIQTEFLKRQ